MSWKTIKSEEMLKNPHVSVRKDVVKLPDGAIIEDLDLLKIPFKTAVEMVMDGRINANSSAHLVLKVSRMKNN